MSEQAPRSTRRAAAGPGAVLSTALRVAELGLTRGLGVLAHLNQVDGFDCPGCAWPESLPPAPARVLRERRQGGRARGDAKTCHARPVRALHGRRARGEGRPLAGGAGTTHRADVAAARRRQLPADRLGRGVRAALPSTCARSAHPTKRSSTPRAAPATRPPSCGSCSRGRTERTTFPTARTCVTSRAAPDSPRRSEKGRARSGSRTSSTAI